ncbi:hypothetical protein BJX65DRAFT_298420 [Aspergillus insuetus]
MASQGISANIPNMTGSWVLDKNQSTGLDEVFKLQGISWITRKAVLAASVTLKITQGSSDGVQSISLEQVLSGGIRGATDKRLLGWTESEHSDTLFGRVIIKSHYVPGRRDSDGKVQPVFAAATVGIDATAEFFLNQAVVLDGYADVAEEDLHQVFLHEFIRSEGSGWTVEQIWSVETIGGETVLTRRLVATKGRTTETARVVFRQGN